MRSEVSPRCRRRTGPSPNNICAYVLLRYMAESDGNRIKLETRSRKMKTKLASGKNCTGQNLRFLSRRTFDEPENNLVSPGPFVGLV
jgi:hypothetical protein